MAFLKILLSLAYAAGCGTATLPWNQMLGRGKRDHLRTCILGSCQWCATWSGGSTDAQCTVGVTPLMKTGCTSASAWAETVQNAPLPSGQVGTRHGNSWVIDDLGVSWKISFPCNSPEVYCGRRCVDGLYWLVGWQTRHWMVEDVLVNRNKRFSLVNYGWSL